MKLFPTLFLVLALAACNDSAEQRLVAPAFAVAGDTGSMKPTLQGGEPLFIEAVAIEDIEVGDIVVFWSGGKNVIHRVIATKRAANGELGLVVKGDANALRDIAIVTADNFIGRAHLTQP